MQALDPSSGPLFPSRATSRVGAWRILLGLLQGIFLYLLYRAAELRAWPANEFLLFVPLVLVALLVPVLAISGLGHLERRRLLLWTGLAALLLAGLGCYDAWRVADLPLAAPGAQGEGLGIRGPRRSAFPSEILVFFASAGLFIAHVLVLAAARDRRRIAGYATYFDSAWTLGVQLAFSALFTGITWMVLFLGAQLFELVELHFLTRLLRKPWFAIPVTAFAFACALHLTDMRPAIVRGIRHLLLVLLSWLLPVAVLLVGGFLLSLPFTGLAPLWSTRRAASVLLVATALFVVLVNAAWQEGGDAGTVARPVRLAARIAALLPAPLVMLAMYALWLRVRDYGWSADRVSAAACMVVAACYAAGYLVAALRPGWLPAIARVNIGTAFVVLGVLLALFSPLADPARIAVASQLARLESGKVGAGDFDFVFLRFEGARFGREALDRLERTAAGPDAGLVRRRIAVARRLEGSWQRDRLQDQRVDLAANLRVHPDGQGLPEAFLRTDWALRPDYYSYPECLRRPGVRCDAFLVDTDGDGTREVLVAPRQGAAGVVLGPDGKGEWRLTATLSFPAVDCRALRHDLEAGKVRTVTPQLADLEIGGTRVRLVPADRESGCRNAAPARPER